MTNFVLHRCESEHYPSVLVAGHRLHVFFEGDEWQVWLNTEVQDFDGLCIGTGSSRDAAVEEAVSTLEALTEFLQGPPSAFQVPA